MDRERREDQAPGDANSADDFKLSWNDAGDRWTEAAEDNSAFSPTGPDRGGPAETPGAPDGVPWDELADDTSPRFEEASFMAREEAKLVPDDDEEETGPHPDDEAPPHGDPLERQADEVFEGPRPAARMDSLQDALASIRERVQTLSSTVQAPSQRSGPASQLALYRAATDDRTLAELRRHGRDTEELLRRMSAMMQDLSLDLRSIVDAARRAIDQTSEQAESSIELGRLLGERIEQMDEQLSARMAALEQSQATRQRGDGIEKAVAKRVDQIDTAIGTLQAHLDKRLSKLEQRSGVGVVRDEVGELRTDLGSVRGEFADVRTDLGNVRTDLGMVRAELGGLHDEVGGLHDEVAAVGGSATLDLQQRLDVVGSQLDRTLTILRDVMEEAPEQDADMVDGVVAAIKTETEAAVEPFRVEVEELGRQLSDALDREEQLGSTLETLTDEVQRLRKRLSVRGGSAGVDDDQIQTIVDAVVAAMPGGRPPAAARRPRPATRATSPRPAKRAPKPEPDDEIDVPEPEPAPKGRRARSRRAKKAAAKAPAPEVDINEPFEPGELDIDDSHLDVEPEEEPIRRARGTGRKSTTTRPVTKSRRTRSGSR